MSTSTSIVPKSRATELAYDAIETLIATLKLEPGQAIVESDLVQLTGLGRTPIREALMRLVATGLIDQQPRRGLRVSEIRIAEHLILIETRRVLEQLIVIGAARRATPAQRAAVLLHAQGMCRAAEKGDLQGYMDQDQLLDHVVHDACRNPYAVQAVMSMTVQCRRFWYAFRYEGDLERGANCHLRLAQGVAAADPDQAVAGADALMDYLTSFTYKVIK
ncbi:MAG: GntR family transcriptional regulator [Burkholderiaceae bacterium]|nr:GntR family transcriptional regulator [Burkholderiaceae bacterium]